MGTEAAGDFFEGAGLALKVAEGLEMEVEVEVEVGGGLEVRGAS